ncbi:glutamine-rich protein 2-like isoform X5 [Haliotis rufescens]|uniref:glutamine-rich protein 2-like isoform X5 n=1 Tax=Haliotis rufescens TaxID=6454 RepID=UPI00201F98DF|nr:glutamine-rich protein 2-like isoform X5 [Haliotis rufescens]
MPTTLPLSNLVDLALGTPEVGAVNFNVLHTLLHAMISKLNIRDVKADINESDRDFLSSTKSQRVMTGLSDIDSGKGEDSEDALSEIRDSSELDSPASSAKHKSKRSVPYHHLELRVEKLAEQLENLNALPTNSDLFERAKAKGDGERPIADMWQYMQLKKRVDANEEGVGKLMSLVEDLMKEMQTLRDTNSNLLDRINGLNIDELNKKLAALEKVTNDLNNKFSTLPTADDFAQFVTWPLLEDALKGVRKDLEELHGSVQEKVVTETGSQTDNRMPSRPSSSHHTSSRPPSSRPLSRLSTTSSGPTNELLDILERIGKLSESHDALTKRVEELEEQLKNKLDKEALEGLNISGDLMEQLNKLKEELDALQSMRDKDTDALSRAQKAILELQAELERLNNITQNIVEENEHRSKQIENLLGYCDTLQDKKADKEYVAMEVDVKADKRQLDNKVNRSVFENTTDEINKIIKEILDKLDGNESSWKDAVAQLADELEGKLDRLELDPLKEWLESRLKALNKKIMANAGNEWLDDDAAGLRKQLLQRFNCLSCDRPVDLMPTGPVQSLPSQNGLPPTRSPRPYTTYELDQIRQSAKSSNCSGYHGTNMVNFERALADKSLARMRRTDLKAYLVHFGQDIDAITRNQRREHGIFNQQDVTDYYATSRQCGGNHTLTYPHKRVSRMTQMNNLFKEDADPAPAPVYPIYKEEVDVQGVDGHIYRGRVERMQIEAKMPSKISPQQSNQVAPISPATPRTLRKIPGLETDPVRGSPTPPTGMRGRPMSARGSASPRPVSGRVPSRPQSTQPTSAAQSGLELSRTTTPYQEDPMLQDGGPTDQGQITVESEAIRVDVPTPDMMEEQTEG